MLKKLQAFLLVLCMLLIANGMVNAASAPGTEGNNINNVGTNATAVQSEIDLNASEIKVAIMGGDWWTPDLANYLDGLPDVLCNVFTSYPGLATLQTYDVVILYGNAQYMYSTAVFTDLNNYVNNGGGLIATPWFRDWSLYYGLDLNSLPVTSASYGEEFYTASLNVTVTVPSDPLLNGVSFVAGNAVGYEGELIPKAGSLVSVKWNDTWNSPAVTSWTYGTGRSAYLNFHYITSDCDRAINYVWGQKLMYNAVVWCAGGGAVNSLAVSPKAGDFLLTQDFNLALIVKENPGVSVVKVRGRLNGVNITPYLNTQRINGTLPSVGQTVRYTNFKSNYLTAAGQYTLNVNVDLSDGSVVKKKVIFNVLGNTEP
ncbi:MAG: hypothetical protein HY934_02850 [Candidatus Firestonebacteria bacterium]|nr:hypothetical protein [Candidatus Firestonebacteria bacterium]